MRGINALAIFITNTVECVNINNIWESPLRLELFEKFNRLDVEQKYRLIRGYGEYVNHPESTSISKDKDLLFFVGRDVRKVPSVRVLTTKEEGLPMLWSSMFPAPRLYAINSVVLSKAIDSTLEAAGERVGWSLSSCLGKLLNLL